VINRDIKLENILLVYCEGRPFLKMCDFGYSINQNHSLPVTAVGTPGYTGMFISFHFISYSLECGTTSCATLACSKCTACILRPSYCLQLAVS